MLPLHHTPAANVRQFSVEIGRERISILRMAERDREERIRRILSRELPHGCRQVVADILDTRVERISRELSHEDDPKGKLSYGVITVALEVLRLEGKQKAAEDVEAILLEGQPLKLSMDVRRITFTKDADGSVRWDIEQ